MFAHVYHELAVAAVVVECVEVELLHGVLIFKHFAEAGLQLLLGLVCVALHVFDVLLHLIHAGSELVHLSRVEGVVVIVVVVIGVAAESAHASVQVGVEHTLLLLWLIHLALDFLEFGFILDLELLELVEHGVEAFYL